MQTTLFLVVGLIERRGGSTSLRRLGGLRGRAGARDRVPDPGAEPGGIPPFSGFIGKVGAAAGRRRSTAARSPGVLVAGGTLTSLLTLYAIARVWTKAFWRSRADAPEGDLADAARRR